ncbi:hypothetical protein M9H77_06079 [Catharanthus roseus]|uniref:Uncharacterized protein n=1 Tax=Catharanthus roseus TaxID=4058 RepID=A0ACC0BR92_CATRO|nr:hypothetical protein M9H77_06079 [Catharanthus roseus]
MAFSSKLKLVFLFLHFFSFIPLSLSNPNYLPLNLKKEKDIHELLPKYNLPIGLLPGNVKSYTLSTKDNSFTIELTHHCYVYFKDQLAYYDTHIRGKLAYGKVFDVHGIQAKKLFIWVSVTGMEVDQNSNMIEFHAGAFTQELPAEDFQTIPVCQEKGFQEIEWTSSI